MFSSLDEDNLNNLLYDYFSKEKKNSSTNFREELSEKIFDFIIKTNDGSYTINSSDFDGKSETMHNSNGAITESFQKFVIPFKNNYMINNNIDNENDFVYSKDIHILDICSGLGYNSSAISEEFLKNKNSDSSLFIDMLEISIETLAMGLLIPYPIESHNIIKRAIELKLIEMDFASLNIEKTEIPKNININIFCEDARETIQNLEDNSYDAIFFDPYSPALAPELCTVEFFKELKKVINNNGIIATYSASSPLRFAMIEAGFYIGEGPIFGRKSGGTIASLNCDNIKKSIPLNDERTIAISDAGIPFRDANLNLNSSQILKNRQTERNKARHNYKLSSSVQTPLFLGKDLDDEKLKRRIKRNLNKVNIPDLKSKEAYYIIEPQKNYNIHSSNENNSRDRIIEMNNRLFKVINN